MQKAIACAAAWTIAIAASAGVNTWTSVGPDGASAQYGLRYLPRAGSAIAATGQGIYRTTDNGQHWSRAVQFSNYGYYQGVAANWNAAAADLVLAHGDGTTSILRSTDAGATWARVAVGDPNYHVTSAAFTHSGGAAWIGKSNGLAYRSLDGGLTWQMRSTGLVNAAGFEQIDGDATAEDTVYAVGGGRLWRTLDAGGTWTLLNAPNDPVYRIATSRTTHHLLLAIKFGNDAGIHRSTDGGATFSLAIAGEFQAVQFFPTTAGRALAIRADRTAIYTEDDGQTWSARGRVGLDSPLVMSFDAAAEQNVLVGTIAGFGFSSDAGSSWSVRNGGIRELTVGGLTTSAATHAVHALTFDDQKVYRRDAGTRQWAGIGSEVARVVTQSPPDQGYALSESPLLPGALFIVNGGRFGRSPGGVAWTALGSVNDGRSIAFDSVDPQLIYVAGLSATRKSVDGGTSWTPIGGGLPPGIQDLVVGSNPDVLYAAKSLYNVPTSSTIYKSVDKGASWNGVGSGIPENFVWRMIKHPTVAGTLFACTQSGLYRSTDGAASWVKILGGNSGSSSFDDVVVDPVRPQILYAISNGYPGDSARSVDGGATWESLRVPGVGAANPIPLYLALVPGEPATLVNARSGHGLFEMVVAPNLRASAGATELLVGVPASLTLSIENTGPFSATGMQFLAALPTSSSAITFQPGSGLDCSLSGQALSCSAPVMRSAELRTVVVGLTAAEHGESVNASVSAYETDENPLDNQVVKSTERRANLAAALTSSAATAQTGTTFTYTASISNDGPSPAALIIGTLTLPSNVTFASVAATGLACTHASGTIACTAATIPAAGSASATITVNAVTAGAANATLAVRGQGVDPVAANDSASRSVTLNEPPPAGSSSSSSSSSGGTTSSSGGGKKGGGAIDYLLLAFLLLALCGGGGRRQKALRPVSSRPIVS